MKFPYNVFTLLGGHMDGESKNEHSKEGNDKTRGNPDESDRAEYYLERVCQYFEKNLCIVFGIPPQDCSKED